MDAKLITPSYENAQSTHSHKKQNYYYDLSKYII